MPPKQLDLDGIPKKQFCYTKDDDKLTQMAKFVVERHMVYLRRKKGVDRKQWTEDYAIGTFRFCNIYRQLDTVSLWIWKNVIQPNSGNPNLPVLVALARLINWPPTIQFLMDRGVWPEKKFNQDKFYRALAEYKERGNKVVTGAYIVNTVYPKDFDVRDPSKIGYITDIAAHDLWNNRAMLNDNGHSTMQNFVEALRSLHGWGSFMSYQVVVDLSYSKKWLFNAPDKNTFNSPGPGTVRGLNRYFTGSRKPTIPKKELNDRIIQQHDELNARVKKLVKNKWGDSFAKGFAPIEMSNVSNCNCEFDKHQRIFYGEGDMKNIYKPQGTK